MSSTVGQNYPVNDDHDMNTTETSTPPAGRSLQTLLASWAVLASAAAIFFAATSPRRIPAWEYWTQCGDPKAFIEGAAERMEQGWEVVTLSVSGSRHDSVGVVVLRRRKS